MSRRIILVSSIFMLAMFGFSMPASAHTSVVITDPLYKSELTSMPKKVSIEFTDKLIVFGDKKINTIQIADPNGADVPLSKTMVSKNVLTAELAPRKFIDGVYIVSYRVVSEDGHGVSGSYELYLNSPAPSASDTPVTEHHSGFIHFHQTHLIESGVVLMLISLWWAYRKFNRETPE